MVRWYVRTVVRAVVLVVKLVLYKQDKDAAGVGRETAHDVEDSVKGKGPRLLHEQRVFIRRLLSVSVIGRHIVPEPPETVQLGRVPDCITTHKVTIVIVVIKTIDKFKSK